MTWTQDPDVAITRWLEGQAPLHAPAELLDTTRALILGTSQRRTPLGWPTVPATRNALKFALAVAALATALAVGIGIGAGIDRPTDGPALTVPSASTGPNASSQPTPAPTDNTVVQGWPGGKAEPAGEYSWDMIRPRWMHNIAETHSVEMWFEATPVLGPLPPGEPVTIAGYEGTLRELPNALGNGRLIHYVVDMVDERVTITIGVTAETSEADVAMAHAVVESIRRVPRPSGIGFRLEFRLDEGWDSG